MKSKLDIFKLIESIRTNVLEMNYMTLLNPIALYSGDPSKIALQFIYLKHVFHLSKLLNISIKELELLVNCPFYDFYKIPKKNGGVREITAPEKTLKRIQQKINQFLQAYYYRIKPDGVYGFTINPKKNDKTYCNILENAAMHVGRKFVLNMDLENFFPSIKASRVKQLFESGFFLFEEHLSSVLALLTTYQKCLPTGAPSSPVISNFICYDMDVALIEFCKSHQLTYTRYADDLTFSSDEYVEQSIIEALKTIIQNHHFKINPKKTRLQSKFRRQTVTGLVVNDKVNVNRRFIKNTRAMIHDIEQNGVFQATQNHFNSSEFEPKDIVSFVNKIYGRIGFIGQIRGKEDRVYQKMKQKFESAMLVEVWEEGVDL
jgi:RNA-directed DNA polymerase